MVRVISVHNFPRQDVSAVDDVIASCVTSHDTLLLAQANHTIRISGDIFEGEKCLPTVDQPVHVEYSTRGNYIATLETRGDVRFVRVYLGWEQADGKTPLRARIAGIVSPLSQNVQGVEMLEVPTPAMPHCIAVCQFSGNLLVGSQDKLSVFKYTVQQHEKSRVEFADLFKTGWNIQLGFAVGQVRLCEDHIAAYNEKYLAILRVNCSPSVVDSKKHTSLKKFVGPIDYDKLVEAPATYDVNFETFTFPSVAAEPQINNTPFMPYSGQAARLCYDSPAKTENLNLTTLLQVQLSDCIISSSARHDVTETFACIRLTPYYSNDAESQDQTSPLGSPAYSKLYAVSCFFGTQQEGYLYHCLRNTQKCSLISVYPFTAPLQDVVLEDALLHALTDAGLETYTLRLPSTHPDTFIKEMNDPACLIGLRPFMHVRSLLLGCNSLYLLVSQDPGTPCTVYRLWLAEPAALWADFLATAEENRWEAPATYSHLVREAHLILRARRERLRALKLQKTEHLVKNEENLMLVDSLYKQSCSILGDHYLLHDELVEANNCYRQSELKLPDLVKRIEHLYPSIPAQHQPEFSVVKIRGTLVQLCKAALRHEDESYNAFGGNREEFYSPDVSSLVSAVLDVFEKEDPENLSHVILSSPIIQQFGSDKSLHILDELIEPGPADSLALALLHLQKGQSERGRTLLASLDHTNLEPLLVGNPHLLHEVDFSSSELTNVLLDLNPKFAACVLSACALEDGIDFQMVQKMLTQLLQGRGLLSKNAADVLEFVIEQHLSVWHAKRHLHGAALREAVNTLTCLYLGRLSQRREVSTDCDVMFKQFRPKYLDFMPPFSPDFTNILSPQHSPTHCDAEPRNVLMKLQCLLGSDLARESVLRVRVLLSQTPKVFGSLSIQVQCAAPPEAAQMLVNFAPQALLAYLKECRLDELSWKNVIEQVQHKITSASAKETKRKFYYEQLMSGLLTQMAQNFSLHTVADLLPPDHPERSHYLRLAYNHEQAHQVRTLIMLTGSQLI